ncbi:MAG: GntR family transcriptional regulator, partial [Halomonas sp.]|nr:GntR family transcriptional regulator [Halomonas sp.]
MDCQVALQQLIKSYAQQPERLSKQVRLEQALRQSINQEWPHQTRLPSHRKLAAALGVARNTFSLAVATLIEEGLLTTSHGSGTWSCKKVAAPTTSTPTNVQLSNRAQRVLRWPGASTVQSGAFVPGIPDIAQFPMRKWRQLYASVTVPQNALLLSYSTGGYGPLKR